MTRSFNRSHTQRKKRLQPSRYGQRQRMMRRLISEELEARMLLTTVTSVDPFANSYDAPTSTNVSATFDEAINAATATPQSFVVRSEMRPGTTSVSTSGMAVTADPSTDFFAGERVNVTATANIQGAATANTARVWQFRAGTSSGSGQFVDTGQVIGPNDIARSDRVAFADIDGDGDLDTFAGTRFWKNDGNGVFTQSGQPIIVGGEEIVFGDVDGDSDLDLIGQSDVFINDGTGNFSAGADLSGDRGAYNTAGAAGDLDGDGDLDIMQGNSYSGNRVFFNNGSGGFTDSGQSLATAGSTDSIKLADFDGDGDLDAFETVNGGANRIWLNDGSGVFAATSQIGGFDGTKDADVGDVDGDGDIDLLLVNNDEGADQNVRIWVNDGAAVFTNSGQGLNNGAANWAGEFADVDADGDLDIVFADRIDRTLVFVNDGAGIFADSGQNLTFGQPGVTRRIFGIGMGDVDGDGDLDLWEANLSSGGNRIWLNQNLQPNVTLSVDTSTIAEAAGEATVTANLSAAHTLPVTIDLAFTGTATETEDYTTSGAQIVISAGATSGAVTINAVDDANDEPDETVITDITNVDNANESGSQQVTTTILDDDEPAPVPDVTLSVDNASIPEEAGVATFTATLSEVTTVPVTVDVSISGSAAASDYTVSGTQIVIAPGATTGSVTVTAVQDTEDENDETVIVDIDTVTGGNESGTQQQTTTITDDDEPVVPDVTLAVDNASIAEADGVATFTATLSESTTVPVTVDLEISGSATAGDDYNASGTQIEIAAGATSGSITVSAVQDELDEPDETVDVDISAVTNGNESGTQQATTTIADDDEPQGFAVTTVTPTDTGFQVAFTNPIDVADLNLYDTQTGGLGPADVVLTGTASGPVTGSLVVSERMVEFIKTGDALAPDTYNITLRSAADGFEDTGGLLLDGDGDGTGGDDFSFSFTVPEHAAGTVTISIPDIVRGPGQEVNLPADTTNGIPLTISEGTNVRAIDARISYDPALLNITGATLGPDAPGGASVIVNTSTPGLAIVVYFATAPLPAGEGNFVNLQASVPEANASENYRRQQVLDVHSVIVSDGNDNESPTVANDALHVSTFFADVTANGRINAADAAGVARIAALIDGGFGNTPLTDPGVVGDISGNGRLNAADASLVAQFAALIVVPQIPPIPGGIVVTGFPWLGSSGEPKRAARPQEPRVVPISHSFGESLDGLADTGEQVATPSAEEASQAADLGDLADDIVDEDLVESLALDLVRSGE